MFNLLFSPAGRISPEEFRKGAIILLAFNFVLWLSWYTNIGLALLSCFAAFGTIYCWFCLFAKRLHDAGYSGWFFVPIFSVFLFAVFFVVPLIVSNILPENPEATALAQEIMELREELNEKAGETTPEEFNQLLREMLELYQMIARRMAIIFFFSGGLIAFLGNHLLKSTSNTNF